MRTLGTGTAVSLSGAHHAHTIQLPTGISARSKYKMLLRMESHYLPRILETGLLSF